MEGLELEEREKEGEVYMMGFGGRPQEFAGRIWNSDIAKDSSFSFFLILSIFNHSQIKELKLIKGANRG